LQKKVMERAEATEPMNLTGFFGERVISYINEFALFKARYNAIPNFVHEIDIDCRRAVKWFMATYQDEIKDFYYNKRYLPGSTVAEPDDIYILLYEDLIVYFDTNLSVVRFLFRKTDMGKVEQVIANIKKNKTKKLKSIPQISLLINTNNGIVSLHILLNPCLRSG
jgi:hypothetical protein